MSSGQWFVLIGLIILAHTLLSITIGEEIVYRVAESREIEVDYVYYPWE